MIGENALDNYLAGLDYLDDCEKQYESQYESGLNELEVMRKEFEDYQVRMALKRSIQATLCRRDNILRLQNKYKLVRTNKV